MTSLSIARSLCAAAFLCAAASAAHAGPIVLLSQTYTADAGTPAPADATPSLFGPASAGGGLIEGPILLDAPSAGVLTISVTDLGLPGNVYEVLVDGASLGTTSPEPIGGPASSSGVFTDPVAAGFHQLDVWDFVQTYLGTDSPYGGAVTDGYFDSGVSVSVTLGSGAAVLAEPGALAVLAPAALALLRRRRRDAC